MTTMSDRRPVVVGVDTHLDVHVAACVDVAGRIIATTLVPANRTGYSTMLRWARRRGEVVRFGIEGTGAYGAGLARHVAMAGIEVLDVGRPDRQLRRRRGKSDTIDAEAAARAALSGQGAPFKASEPDIEGIRALRLARRSAIKARTQAINQLHALVVTAPTPLRARLQSLSQRELIERCARLRAVGDHAATRQAMASLARRITALGDEKGTLEQATARLVEAVAPSLLELQGVGPDVAAALLIAAGDNPDRLRNEAAFAALCGASPVPASSGRVQRHRLNRGGDRQANNALWRIVFVRLTHDPRTRAYVTRRSQEGLSKKEIIRCLKRYVAREVFATLSPS
jgi:transposase